MENNFSSCTTVTFEPRDALEPELADFLDGFFDVSALNYTDSGQEEYVGYAPIDFDPKTLTAAAEAGGITLPPFSLERLENKNWLTENVIKFDPIETSDFCIYGIHEKEAPKTKKHLIKVYAATAFGSGHQTTRACLEALGFLFRKGLCPKKILDIGTGSGILSLGAVRLWQSLNPTVVAVDIDDEAVRVATQNAFDNGLEDYLHIAQSDGYKAAQIARFAPYDLILANILARPLTEMAPELVNHLKDGGYCVLSGFVSDQIDWVVQAHEQVGLTLVQKFHFDNWYAVVMEKKS
jgi:ribosomal protein L11 methyltransferase